MRLLLRVLLGFVSGPAKTRRLGDIMLKTSLLAGVALAVVAGGAQAKTIGLSLGSLGNPFFIALVKGAEFEAKRTNRDVKLLNFGYDYDFDKQVNQIDNFIAAGVDLILLTPSDPKALRPAIQKAQAAGIKVVSMDVVTEGVDAAVTNDDIQAGQIACQYFIDKLGKKGNVIIENGPQVFAVINRVNGCKKAIANAPDMKILSSDQDGKGSRAAGLTVMKSLLTRFPRVDAIFAINDPQAIGSNLAAMQLNRSGMIITSVDGAPDIEAGLKDPNWPMIEASASQDPFSQGRKAVDIGLDLLDGKEPAERVTLLPLKLVTRDNVNDYKGWTSNHADTLLIERLPPVITIDPPGNGSAVAWGMVEIRYRVRMPSGGKLDRVEAFVDGVKIEARGLGPSAGATSPRPSGPSVLTLPMPAHDATISLVAYADGEASDAARIRLKGVAAATPPDDAEALKPNLYALLIGITHYDDKSFDLGYAADDARAFAEALKSQEGRLYRHVEVKVLTDKDATVSGVREGLVWLSRQTTSHDLAIVFEAGHGLQDKKGRFFFGTSEMDPARLFATAFSNDEMEEAIADLPGKKMLFMDACHAGAALDGHRDAERVDMSEAINNFAQAESGMVVFGASTGREVSYESDEWHHGAFTKALIEGIGEGKADLTHQGTVTTASLDFFLAERVKQLTDGRQHPVMNRPKTVPDFPIASLQ